MTNMPEAKLAREAEICYATVAMVTDYDCWHDSHDHVTVDAVIRVLLSNAEKARDLVRAVIPVLGAPRGLCPAKCDRALDHALITAPAHRDPVLLEKLRTVGRPRSRLGGHSSNANLRTACRGMRIPRCPRMRDHGRRRAAWCRTR